MKLNSIFLFFCFFSSCSQEQHQEAFPIDYVLKNSLPQQSKLIIKDLNDYQSIDTNFLNIWIKGLNIPEMGNEKFDYSYSDCYFIDHRKIDDKIVFSIVKNCKGGILNLYYLTYDTLSRKILGINYLTFEGGDEGYLKRNIIEWTDKNSIQVTSIENLVEELSDSTNLIKQDSIITQFSYANRPFKGKVIFRQSKSDTIPIKKK